MDVEASVQGLEGSLGFRAGESFGNGLPPLEVGRVEVAINGRRCPLSPSVCQ